jgi:hypothetical protein
MEYDDLKEEEITFSYMMYVDPGDGGDIDVKVEAMETVYFDFFVDELNCENVSKPSSSKDSKSRRRQLGRHRKLEVIALSPLPADSVGKFLY